MLDATVIFCILQLAPACTGRNVLVLVEKIIISVLPIDEYIGKCEDNMMTIKDT